RVVREIADALGYAHRRGIVHRDVKPSNILLDEDSGRALLADFGIARVEGAGESSLTQPGAAIGTPGYMAPEQAASGRVDGRADLHSLAAVAFEALGGGAPAFKADRAGLVRALRTARPDMPARLATALVAPLAERPDGCADRERAPLERGGPGPRLSPRGEVLRAGERGLRGADGHAPGDPVRGRPGPTQREGGGTRRRGGVGGDGPRVGRAVPGVHARRGRHAPERRPRGAGRVLERRSGVPPGRLSYRARRVHPCHSCGLRIRHRAAAARARRRA